MRENNFNNQKIIQSNQKFKLDIKPNNYLFAIKCFKCTEFNNDYKSSFFIQDSPVSLFCNKSTKKDIESNNKIKCYEFIECYNYFLIGTKNEIISNICQKNNKLKEDLNTKENRIKELISDKEAYDKSITKLRNNLNDEQAKKEIIEKDNKSLKEQLKKEHNSSSKLNLKIEELLKEQQILNNKINDLKTNLNTEKNKNKDLNDKLENISSQNNENVRKILEQVESEKLTNKNFSLKIAKLEEKESHQSLKIEELEKSIKQKDKEIQNLSNINKSLGNNIKELSKNLTIKENTVREVNDFLNKEKNINKDISNKLKHEKEKNKELNDKLDNIASENNENMKNMIQQLQDEKVVIQNLKSKYSEIKNQKDLQNKENEELESQLKKKDEELQKVINDYIPDNFGLKFESDSKTGEYDIILDITSFKDLIRGGWLVKYNKEGKQKYLNKKDEPTIVAGVIGNGNKGKSFFLEKLSGYEIPKGFNVKTIGLSIRYGTSKEHNVAILDSAGQETPLLKMEKDNLIIEDEKEGNGIMDKGETPYKGSNYPKEFDNSKKEENNEQQLENKQNENKDNDKINQNNIEKQNKNEASEDEKNIEFEQYSRDKLITEYFLQKFIIWKSDVLILVVGNISLTEQKLLLRVKKEVKNLDKNKQIFVIHNLKDYSTEEQVNDYIENTLKKLYKIELEETNQQNILKEMNYNNDSYFNKYYIEKDGNVSHFIFVNEFSQKAKYYNTPTIRHIQKEIEVIKTRTKFSIIDDCKQFLVKISEEIMEENPKLENLITIEGDKSDKIILKSLKEITLKNFVVDEVGFTLSNDSNIPKHSYYINPEEKILYINIELPGGGTIEPTVTVQGNSYYFIYEGIKNGDKIIEEDKKNEKSKLIQKKNNRKSNKFKLIITIPCSVIQVKLEDGEELNEVGDLSNDGKGVYTFKYKVIVNQKNDKKKKKKLEL